MKIDQLPTAKIWLFLPLLFFFTKTVGQEWANSWQGPFSRLSGSDLVAMPNGNFMATGRAIDGYYDGQGFFIPTEADFYLLEINQQGDTVRSIHIRDREPGVLELASVIEMDGDNGFIVAGQLESGNANEDLLVIKTDEAGNLIWEKTFDLGEREDFREIIRTADSGFLLTGYYKDTLNSYTGFAMKIDGLGNQQWQLPLLWPMGKAESASTAVQLVSGELLIGGRGSFSNGATSGGYLLKIDADGGFIGVKEFEEIALVNSIATTSNGNIYMGVYSTFNFITAEFEVMKTDAAGNIIWHKAYPSGGFDSDISLKNTASDDIAFAGTVLTFSENGFDVDDSYAYFGLIDSMGNLLSSIAYEPAESSESLFNIAENTNGCLAAVGASEDTITGAEPQLFCILFQCSSPINAANAAPTQDSRTLQITPNPVSGHFVINLDEAEYSANGKLSIFDSSGRLILLQTTKSRCLEISTAGWPAGMYQVFWETEKGAISGQMFKI